MARNPFENFYTDLLAEQPQLAYQATVSRQFPQFDAMTRPQRRHRDYWGDQYQNIYNEYLGTQGQGLLDLARGQQPQQSPQSFSQYLENVPFTQRYAALTPQQRGTTTRRFAPSTRYIFY